MVLSNYLVAINIIKIISRSFSGCLLGGFSMTKKKQALLSVIGAVVVLTSLAGLVYYQINENATVKVQERVQKVCTLDNIYRMEFKDNDLVVIEKNAEGWQNPEFSYLNYEKERISDWLKNLDTMQTKKIVKNVEDESVYGFTNEHPMITLYDEMNKSQTLHMGRVNEEEQVIYIKSDQDDVIYMVDIEEGKTLFTSPNTFVNCEDILLPKVGSQLNLIKGNENRIEMILEERWYITEYFQMPYALQEEVISGLIEVVEGLSITEYIGTYETLSDYGLESPQLELELGEDRKISFGNVKGDVVYVTLNGGKDVYTMDKVLYLKLKEFNPFEAIDKQFAQWPIEEVNQIELSNPQGTYTLVLDEEMIKTVTQEQSNEELEEVEQEKEQKIAALFNEQVFDEEEARACVEKINASLSIEALLQNPGIEQKQDRKAEATIKYTLKDDSELVIELIPYDINYYILRYNGSVEFAVNKEKVTKLFTEMNHLDQKTKNEK